MSKHRHLLLALCLIVASTVLLAAQRPVRLQQIDRYIQAAMKVWNVPGVAIAIVKDDVVVLSRGYGVRELGNTDPVGENTVFPIASNSKAFTAAALAILVDEGKLAWDDPVVKHLPSFQMHDPYVTRELRVRDLLSHRSGLRTFGGDLLWYETNYSRAEVLRRIRYLPPASSFRSQFGYQNIMFVAAGEIVPAVTRASWDGFLGERILEPLGMRRTVTSVAAFAGMADVARPHNESTGKLRVLPYGNVDGSGGAAAMNSSVRDLAQWLRLQLGRGRYDGRQIFSQAASREMWSPQTITPLGADGEAFIPSRHFTAYGLGWELSDYRGHKIVSHSGALDGFYSGTAMVPEANLGVVILTNSETALPLAVANWVIDAFLEAPERDWSADFHERYRRRLEFERQEERARAERAGGTRATLPLAGYAGVYRSDLYGDVSVTEEGGKLVLRMVPAARLVADLAHWQRDTFEVRWRDSVPYNFRQKGFAVFRVTDRGSAEGLQIDQPNPDFHFFELDLARVR
jgi:CubicO group peptidase (beta-lactamase class C family)